jgi:hypothetical protein
MTYPESAAVSAGQPTAVDHYNKLRLDALYFGQAAADAVAVGALLSRWEKNLNIVLLDTDRVRVEASPTSTVELMIDGVPVQATANVDLASGNKPSGAAATWYIFAERTASSTTFTLNANTSSAEYTNARLIGQVYWDGSKIVELSIVTDWREQLITALKYRPAQATQARLTLATGDPIPASDQSGGTLYITPHQGKTIDLYAPGRDWIPIPFSEDTISFSGVASGTNSDIFARYSAGAITFEKQAWTDDTNRAEAVSLQDGRYVMTSDKEYLLLGTVRTSALGVLSDSILFRGCANIYNPVPRLLYATDLTASWTYGTVTWRQARAQAANKVEAVFPLPHSPAFLKSYSFALSGAGSAAWTAIGVDQTTAPNSNFTNFGIASQYAP